MEILDIIFEGYKIVSEFYYEDFSNIRRFFIAKSNPMFKVGQLIFILYMCFLIKKLLRHSIDKILFKDFFLAIY